MKFSRNINSKKNSCRGNYMRKYGTLTKFYNDTYLILQQQINLVILLLCPTLIHNLKTDLIQFHKIILGSARTQQSSCWWSCHKTSLEWIRCLGNWCKIFLSWTSSIYRGKCSFNQRLEGCSKQSWW